MGNVDGWIPLDQWCEQYGERKNTVLKRITNEVWLRGEVAATPDGGEVFIHEERAKKWLAQKGKMPCLP